MKKKHITCQRHEIVTAADISDNKTNHMLGLMARYLRTRRAIWLVVDNHLKQLVQIWSPGYKKDIELLDRDLPQYTE